MWNVNYWYAAECGGNNNARSGQLANKRPSYRRGTAHQRHIKLSTAVEQYEVYRFE